MIKALEAAGWALVRTEGDHRTFKKDGIPEVVTISGHGRDEVRPGQLSDIRKKSRLPLR